MPCGRAGATCDHGGKRLTAKQVMLLKSSKFGSGEHSRLGCCSTRPHVEPFLICRAGRQPEHARRVWSHSTVAMNYRMKSCHVWRAGEANLSIDNFEFPLPSVSSIFLTTLHESDSAPGY